MKYLIALMSLVPASLLGGCSTTQDPVQHSAAVFDRVALAQPVSRNSETLLLVSLEDGSVIMQTISSDADICFKQNSSSATKCLVQGAPIVDPVTQAVIGFETTETHIELIASSSH